jgi:hypothetical protein
MEEPRKKWWKELLWELKWILIWTGLFVIAGIIIQSLREGQFVFIDFFWANYKAWLSSFGNLTQFTQYAGYNDVLKQILADWYYFFYSGGLISLVWGLLSFMFRKLNKKRIEAKRQRTYDEITEQFEQREKNS